MIRVGINGFGRIGRRIFRLIENHPDIQVIAINDLADTKTFSHLLKYDSIHGIFDADMSYNEHNIIVNNRHIPFTHHKHPMDINWRPCGKPVPATGASSSPTPIHCTAVQCITRLWKSFRVLTGKTAMPP